MKRRGSPFVFVFMFLVGCKTDKINGNSIKEFQESVNEMSSSVNTIRQVKFREALHVIKQFGVDERDNLEKMNAMAGMLHGKKISEIFSLADSIALVHGLDWSSDAPPSLDEVSTHFNGSISLDSLDVNSGILNADSLVPLDGISNTLIFPSLEEPGEFIARFLQNISEKRLLEAYRMSDNPDWESFDIFSNSNSGFGSVKHIGVENIVVENSDSVNEANVNAECIVIDNTNRKIRLNISFVLRNYVRNWKIIHYEVNSKHK